MGLQAPARAAGPAGAMLRRRRAPPMSPAGVSRPRCTPLLPARAVLNPTRRLLARSAGRDGAAAADTGGGAPASTTAAGPPVGRQQPAMAPGRLRGWGSPAVPPRSATAPGSGTWMDETVTADLLAQHLGMVLFSSWALAATSSAAGLSWPLWAPAAAGAALGGCFAAAHRHAAARLWRPPAGPLRLVVTGGTRGLGKALARQALLAGDAVVITGRRQSAVDAAVRELRGEVAALREMGAPGAAGDGSGGVEVHGVVCDVSVPEQVHALGAASAALLGGAVDGWVVNAGQSGSFKTLLDQTDEAVEQVVRTNLLGGLLCAREAAARLSAQPEGGHIFLIDGAGSDGGPTPYYAAYGATKAALPQLAKTLRSELAAAAAAAAPSPAAAAADSVGEGGAQLLEGHTRERSPVGVHVLSPGMMITELLLEGATDTNKQVFNILCEHPETVAAFLVPRLRTAVARGQGGSYTRYLTPATAAWRFLTAPARVGRFFDAKGAPCYQQEHERILGSGAETTKRAQAAAAARGGALRAAYSLSVAAAAVVVAAADAVAKATGQ